ncbi:phosphodiester glycosidase family protein [Paracoccus sp. p3-h83]|uniref:phosphodiester glycosidase family protein n=1 Tax=Paracoccus sp. p3-h83 TaxID=3342805 RepID=UPI0035B84DD2
MTTAARIKRRLGLIAGAGLALLAGPVSASDTVCAPFDHDGIGAVVCTVRAGADLRLWLRDGNGHPYGQFSAVAEALPAGERLVFAMNAGMYHLDRSPVGLHIENGRQIAPIVTASGPGNFGMRPNGVFCVTDRFAVIESRAFAKAPPDCRFASQSGPMLVIDGDLHPRFLPDSRSRYIRNGVGVSRDGQTAYFAISNRPVTFHDFARLFRDGLDVPNALYFDGSISRLYAPSVGRADLGRAMGPIIGVVAPKG